MGACGSTMSVAWASDPGLPACEAGTSIPWICLRQPGQTGLGGQGCALGLQCSCWAMRDGPSLPPARPLPTPCPHSIAVWAPAMARDSSQAGFSMCLGRL